MPVLFLAVLSLTGCLLAVPSFMESRKQTCLQLSQARAVSCMTLLLQACMLCLQILDLSSTNMGAAGMTQLVSANIPRLLHLSLSNNQLDAAAIEQLVNHSWRLNSLLLDGNNLDDAAMAYLCQSKWFTSGVCMPSQKPDNKSGLTDVDLGCIAQFAGPQRG